MSEELRAAVGRFLASESGIPVYLNDESELEDLRKIARAYLAEHPADGPPVIWTDEECFQLNAGQHLDRSHPYTCGTDSTHRPLIATRQGWRCADCDYRQGWAHGVTPKESS